MQNILYLKTAEPCSKRPITKAPSALWNKEEVNKGGELFLDSKKCCNYRLELDRSKRT